MDTTQSTSPSTLYTEMEELYKKVISIHNSVISVSNQLGFSLPTTPEKDDEVCIEDTTVRNTLKNIHNLVSITRDRAINLEENVK